MGDKLPVSANRNPTVHNQLSQVQSSVHKGPFFNPSNNDQHQISEGSKF